ncbi:LPXTG cell wall anchor domain-containing protein [Micromonospora zamorensis]|uniref:LPXTG cell wall anchor domain-containing protein n=1 Tax=Micromonospora zamorensis TaxID=709883 RepID=UPI003CF00FFE
MRWKTPAGALIALAFLIPAAPAMAQTPSLGLNAACETVKRDVYQDIRKLTLDLDTIDDGQLRLLAYRILDEAQANKFPVLPGALEKRLAGTPDDLRAYLKSDVQKAWLTDLRVSVGRTMVNAGDNVDAAAQKVLDEAAVDAYLAYLNDGVYVARALDCASKPTPTPSASASATPSASPSATTTVAPTPTSSASLGAPGGENGEGGGLPVTGANTATVAGIGGALLLLGGVGYLVGRRRRSSFVA